MARKPRNKNHKIVVNGVEVIPCKKVNLLNYLTLGQIRQRIRQKRLE